MQINAHGEIEYIRAQVSMYNDEMVMPGNTTWSVYMLRCADNTLYTGITSNMRRRVDEHNSDNRLASAYTRSRRPVMAVYAEEFRNRSEALRREIEIKQLSRHEKEALIKSKLLD